MSSSLGSSSLNTSTVQPGRSGPPCQCSAPTSPSFSNLLPSFRPLRISSLCTLSTPKVSGCFSILLLPLPPDPLRVLQWNAGGLRDRSAELLHFVSSHSGDLICNKESNLNPSSSFWIPGFSALRSDRTHSRSSILSPDDQHANGGVNIFVRQSLSISELSTSSLSLLDP